MTKDFLGKATACALCVSLLFGAVACGNDRAPTSGASGNQNPGSDPIGIGLFQPLAAAIGGFGWPAVNGARLAVDQINAGGGINGRMLELLVQDNGCTTTDGANAVQKLLSEDRRPVALIGGLCSDSTLAALPIAERNQIPLLVDLASNPSITEQSGIGGNQWAFHWAPNDIITAQAAIEFLVKLGDTYVAMDDELNVLWSHQSKWVEYANCPAYIPSP
jgi:ABC-type branched-subunit amino acid transport system substrate-binding protein